MTICSIFLIFGTINVAATSAFDNISYEIECVEPYQTDSLKVHIIFHGKRGTVQSYEFSGYLGIYELGTNKLLNLEEFPVTLNKPFLSSSSQRLILPINLTSVEAKMFKIKAVFFDKNHELKPVPIFGFGTNKWIDYKEIPNYYIEESERVANRINDFLHTTDHDVLTFGVISDSHIGIGIPEEKLLKDSLHHGIFGLNTVGSEIGCDFIAHLGDTTWKNNLDTYDSFMGSCYTIDAFNSTMNYHYVMRLIGNHDQTNSHQRQWTAIGQHNQFEVTGVNPKRNYGYTDFDNKKVRVIALNTSDYLNGTGSYGISYEQRLFLMSALDLSDKIDAKDWSILILSHIPLDFYYRNAQWHDYDVTKDIIGILKAYQEGTTYTIQVNDLWKIIHHDTISQSTLTYDYSGKNAAKIIGNIHGHLHNDCYGTLAYRDFSGIDVATNIVRVSTPNASFYGAKGTAYPNKGNYVAKEIKKVANTAKDTSVTFYVIDLTDNMIYSYAYGAGNDRVIPY